MKRGGPPHRAGKRLKLCADIVLSNAISGRQPGSGEDAIHTSVIWIREIILLAVGMCGIFIDVSRVIGLKKKKKG